MTSIRRVRKAFKRKYGIKTVTYRVYYKNNQNWKSHTNLTHPVKVF